MVKVRHSGIVVRDLKESLDFYRYLGFRTVNDDVETGEFIDNILGFEKCEVRTVKMICDGKQMIELLEYRNPESPDFTKLINSIGCSHLALTVDNLELLYENLIKKGVDFVNPPCSNEKVKVAFCIDPNDVYLELVEEL